MALENTSGPMEIHMKDIGKITNTMEKDIKNQLMVDPTKEIGVMAICMDEVFINGPTDNNMKGNT